MKELFEEEHEFTESIRSTTKIITINKNLVFKEAVLKIANEVFQDLRYNMLHSYLQFNEKRQEYEVNEEYQKFDLEDLVEDLRKYGGFRRMYKVVILENLTIAVVIWYKGENYSYYLNNTFNTLEKTLTDDVKTYEPEEKEKILNDIKKFKKTKEYRELRKKCDGIKVIVSELYKVKNRGFFL